MNLEEKFKILFSHDLHQTKKKCYKGTDYSPQTLFFLSLHPVAEFKEFERRFKFKPRFKYDWFHLKLYQMFQDLSRRFI